MGFRDRLKAAASKSMADIQAAQAKKRERAEDKARDNLAKAQTKGARDKVLIGLERDKLKLEKQLFDDRTALVKSRSALAQSKKGSGSGVGGAIASFLGSKPKPKVTRKRKKVVGKKTAKKKVTGKKVVKKTTRKTTKKRASSKTSARTITINI